MTYNKRLISITARLSTQVYWLLYFVNRLPGSNVASGFTNAHANIVTGGGSSSSSSSSSSISSSSSLLLLFLLLLLLLLQIMIIVMIHVFLVFVALLMFCSSSSSSSSSFSFSWCFSCFIFCFLTLVTSGFSLLTSRKLMTAQSQFGTYWIGENGDSRPQCLLKVLTYVLFWLMRRKAPGSRLRNCVYGTQRLKPPFMVNHDSNNGHFPRHCYSRF